MVEIIVLNHLASHRSQLKTRRSFTFFRAVFGRLDRSLWNFKCAKYITHRYHMSSRLFTVLQNKCFRKILEHPTSSINSSIGKRRNEAKKEKRRYLLGQSSYNSGSMFTLPANVSQNQCPPQLLRSNFLKLLQQKLLLSS